MVLQLVKMSELSPKESGNDGSGDSSRESGIDEAQHDFDKQLETEGTLQKEVEEEADGCQPNDECGVVAGPEEEQENVGKDVKKITGFDKVASQQKRRVEALQLQKQ